MSDGQGNYTYMYFRLKKSASSLLASPICTGQELMKVTLDLQSDWVKTTLIFQHFKLETYNIIISSEKAKCIDKEMPKNPT